MHSSGSARRLSAPRLIAACVLAAAVNAVSVLPMSDAHAAEKRHGLSVFGELKYPADFKHFDYVKPDAPKGGKITAIGTAGLITFDSFNGYILKGDPAQGLGRTASYLTVFDQLMVRAWDEPDSIYGLVAQSAEVADDRKSVTFYLRPEARFSDGSKLTAADVVWSFETLKSKGHPAFQLPLRDVEVAEAIDEATVKFSFKGKNLRDLPLIVGTLPVFSKAWYASRSFDKTSLEPPVGSGPYKITKFKQGSFVTYTRRDDYWAKDLPVNRGKYNFDQIKFLYFKDRAIELEALKGGEVDLREEFTSRDWARAYDVPPVRDGRIQLLTLPDDNPSGTQGFFFNLRRDKFKDIRVRQALDHAFDFEWTNKNLFFRLYKRTQSYFENSTMKAVGAATGAEKSLIDALQDKAPKGVADKVYVPPVSNASGQDRKLLRKASALLRKAGWTVKDGKRVNAAGKQLRIEFLIFSPSFERIILPYVKNLKVLGIDGVVRRVDPAQYQRLVKDFDFDITTARFSMSNTPGPELRAFFGSASANTAGSYNLSGIKSPAVDALIEKVVTAKSRTGIESTVRALDRVLMAGNYWVPQWYKGAHNIAHWNKFSRPETKPKFHRGVFETWWYDAAKAAKLKSN